MLIFMKHTGVGKRLSVWERSLKFEARWTCETNPISGRRQFTTEAQRSRRRADVCSRMADPLGAPPPFASFVLFVVEISAKRTQFAGDEAKGKGMLEKGLRRIRPNELRQTSSVASTTALADFVRLVRSSFRRQRCSPAAPGWDHPRGRGCHATWVACKV